MFFQLVQHLPGLIRSVDEHVLGDLDADTADWKRVCTKRQDQMIESPPIYQTTESAGEFKIEAAGGLWAFSGFCR